MRRVVKAVKTIVLGILALGVIWILWRATFGYRMKDGELYQLKYNLLSARDENEVLQEENSKLKSALEEEKLRAGKAEQQNATGDSSSYLDIKFPSDGNYYVDSYQSKFYRDANCTQLIDNPRFLSWKQDEDLESPSGFPIKAMRLDSGELCYCPRDTSVYPVTEAKWEEYLAEQAEREAAAEE